MANKGKPFSVDYPRITFQAPGRTFNKLLKEKSLSDLRETVRKKLGLGSGSVVQFTQLRSGQLVDLKDEDGFGVFRAIAYEQRHAVVQVVLTESPVVEDNVDAKSSTSPIPPTPANALPDTGGFGVHSNVFVQGGSHEKVVPRNEDAIEVNLEASGPIMPFRNSLLLRTEDRGIGPMPSHRTRSSRGEKRSEASKAAAAGIGLQARGPAYGQSRTTSQAPPVAPLKMTEYRWDRRYFYNKNPNSPEVVDRKVKALLNKLTMKKFDFLSDQIIQWANRSEEQKDGRTLIQVIRLVFEKATYEAMWSEMYALLCRKMMEQISPKVQDEGIRHSDGNPITGGQLFRKYLLNRCQEDFERGWFAKEATAAAKDQTNESGEVGLYFDEYYAAQKARRQGLGLIKFIGELFKLQMLTERIMHECIKKLLGNVQNPREEEVESLCMLLTTVGSLLDNQKARAHLDIYFQRMHELNKNVNPRMQFMLQDLIELRDRKWQARNAVASSTTIAQAAKETTQRLCTSYSCSRRETQDQYPKADRRNCVSRAAAQASDPSQFGRFGTTQLPTKLGPSTPQEAQQESNKEPPANLVEEPPVSVFFNIRNLLVTLLQSIYIVPALALLLIVQTHNSNEVDEGPRTE